MNKHQYLALGCYLLGGIHITLYTYLPTSSSKLIAHAAIAIVLFFCIVNLEKKDE